MKERLCGECVSQNECWFVNTFNKRMDALPPFEKQMPIAPGVKFTEESSAVSDLNEEDRIKARSYGCPQVNYEPQNPKFQPNL